jgi:DNA-binding NarL/FixJ family response regulator
VSVSAAFRGDDGIDRRPILVCADHARTAEAVVDAVAYPFATAVPLTDLAGRLERRDPPGVALVILVTESAHAVARVRHAVSEHAPDARLLAVSYHPDDESALRFVAAGADGIVPSPTRLGDLLVAIGNLEADRTYLELDTVRRLRDLVAERILATHRSAPLPGVEHLSARERDVLADLAERHTNKQIAAHLHVQEQTVKNHVTSLLRKLGLQSRFEAARAAADLPASRLRAYPARGGGHDR